MFFHVSNLFVSLSFQLSTLQIGAEMPYSFKTSSFLTKYLVSGSVTVSELSVEKVLGVFREIKRLQLYPEGLWKAAARISSKVPELWFSRAEIFWHI